MPQSLNWWFQSSFRGTHSARKHATWPLNFGDKLQIEHFRPQPWTLKTLPKGSNCIHFKYRFNVVMKRTHFFLYDNLITENKFARCLNINQRIVIILICKNIFYIESNIFPTTRNYIVTSTLKLLAFWEEIQSFSYKIKGPNWRGSNLGNNSNCCCFFHSFVYYNYMTIQKTTVHSGLNYVDKYITRIAHCYVWARLAEQYIQRGVLLSFLYKCL